MKKKKRTWNTDPSIRRFYVYDPSDPMVNISNYMDGIISDDLPEALQFAQAFGNSEVIILSDLTLLEEGIYRATDRYVLIYVHMFFFKMFCFVT